MALAHVGGNIGWLLAPGLKTVQTRYYKKSPELFSACNLSAKYASLPDKSDVCLTLTFTMQFYNGLHSIVRQMSDVSLQNFAYTDLCKCMFLSVFTYSSNPLTQISEIVQLTRWAHSKFPPHFLPWSRHKKHGESLLLLASKFRCSHVNLKLWLSPVIGVKRWRGAECVHVSSPAKLHDVFEFQHWLFFTSCSQTAALTPESGDV